MRVSESPGPEKQVLSQLPRPFLSVSLTAFISPTDDKFPEGRDKSYSSLQPALPKSTPHLQLYDPCHHPARNTALI